MEALLGSSSDEPPTSTVLLDSYHFSQVIFTGLEKFYVPGADIVCHYNLSQHISPRKKDWVGIFRVGWKTTSEYYTFMWAPLPSNPDSKKTESQQIHFKAYYLPKDDEYYQFCYVDQDGVVRGASVPFQFRAETEDDMLVVTTQGEVEEIEQHNKTLLHENQKLKESFTNLQKQNETLQEKLEKAQDTAKEFEGKAHLLQIETMELQKAQDLQALEKSSAQVALAAVKENNIKLQKENQDLQKDLEMLRSSTEKLDVEVNLLKNGILRLQESKGEMEAALCQAEKENKSVLSEKEELENKLKMMLDCMGQLQSQVQSQQKEVENLQAADHDKARQLEKLKEENSQLHATLLKQEKYGDLNTKLEEQMHLFQILQKEKDEVEKKNQILKRENEELMVYVPEVKDVGQFSAGPPAEVHTRSPGDAALVFGNPYCASSGLSNTNLVSVKKCLLCDEIFPNDIGDKEYSDHAQSHLLECPYCEETFDSGNKQVYNDHVFCHSLD